MNSCSLSMNSFQVSLTQFESVWSFDIKYFLNSYFLINNQVIPNAYDTQFSFHPLHTALRTYSIDIFIP